MCVLTGTGIIDGFRLLVCCTKVVCSCSWFLLGIFISCWIQEKNSLLLYKLKMFCELAIAGQKRQVITYFDFLRDQDFGRQRLNLDVWESRWEKKYKIEELGIWFIIHRLNYRHLPGDHLSDDGWRAVANRIPKIL